jgi:hypothetical protein
MPVDRLTRYGITESAETILRLVAEVGELRLAAGSHEE